MKKKFNQIPTILLLSLIIVFTNCNRDELYEANNPHKVKATSRYITFNELKNNQKAFGEFQKVEQKVNLVKSSSQAGLSSRLVYLSQYNFIIDTDKILLIEKGDYKSFTFPIYREEETEKTENLVITEKNNEVYAYLSNYTLSEIDRQKIENKEFVDLINKTEVTKLQNQAQEETCYELVSIPQEINSQGQVTVSFVYAVEVDCPDGGGTAGGGSGGGGSWGGGSWGGGSWGGGGNDSGGDWPGGGGVGGSIGGGYYGGGSTGGSVSGGPNPGNYQDPSLSDWDGSSIVTYPVLDDKDNIKDLNKLTNNKPDGTKTIIKNRIDQLKSLLLTSIKENGSMFDSDQNILPPFNTGPNFTSWANSGQPQYYISLHMHQNNYIPKGTTSLKPSCPVQSDTDVLNFLLLHRQTNNKNTTAMLVSRLGTFAIRANNRNLANDAFDALSNQDDDSALKEFVKNYNNLVMTPYESTPMNDYDILQGYIKFINSHLVNGYPMGIGLYQAVYDNEGNIINWVKL